MKQQELQSGISRNRGTEEKLKKTMNEMERRKEEKTLPDEEIFHEIILI